MANCKECLCEIPCRPSTLYDMYQNNSERCPFFKNKANFVEVVRCGKCQHSRYIGHKDNYECRKHNGCLKYPHDFCSYGISREESC